MILCEDHFRGFEYRALSPPLKPSTEVGGFLIKRAGLETDSVLKRLETQLTGLSEADADLCQKQYGINEFARESANGS